MYCIQNPFQELALSLKVLGGGKDFQFYIIIFIKWAQALTFRSADKTYTL